MSFKSKTGRETEANQANTAIYVGLGFVDGGFGAFHLSASNTERQASISGTG